jgi:uncharacterized protein (DUF924 family)
MMLDSQTKEEGTEPAWVDDVLRFWFERLSEEQWWKQDDTVDAQIRDRFLALHERLSAQADDSLTTPRSLLAAVIVLDQFSRNLFRRTPRAYAADPIARRLAKSAIERGFNTSLTALERQFLYLPFEHSEDAADQQLSLELFTSLGNDEWTRFAVAHKEVIDRFGRFPHRNAVLGRSSTDEELELLKARVSWF